MNKLNRLKDFSLESDNSNQDRQKDNVGDKKIEELGIKLPEPKSPVGAYGANKIVGNLLYISGQISVDEKGELIKGKLGKNLDKIKVMSLQKDVV